jgi:cell shape-determining protein MreD
MNWLNSIAILVTAFLVVFFESTFGGVRRVFGAQVDLLPALVVYASLTTGIITLSLLSLWGGFWYDSLSANPLGVSVLPLFLTGMAVYLCRDLILRDQRFAQFVTGIIASAVVPLLTLLLVLNLGHRPLIGWQSLWQLLVMCLAGGLFTPVAFLLFDRFDRAFSYQPMPDSSFRADRQIKRGRN